MFVLTKHLWKRPGLGLWTWLKFTLLQIHAVVAHLFMLGMAVKARNHTHVYMYNHIQSTHTHAHHTTPTYPHTHHIYTHTQHYTIPQPPYVHTTHAYHICKHTHIPPPHTYIYKFKCRFHICEREHDYLSGLFHLT